METESDYVDRHIRQYEQFTQYYDTLKNLTTRVRPPVNPTLKVVMNIFAVFMFIFLIISTLKLRMRDISQVILAFVLLVGILVMSLNTRILI